MVEPWGAKSFGFSIWLYANVVVIRMLHNMSVHRDDWLVAGSGFILPFPPPFLWLWFRWQGIIIVLLGSLG